MFNWIKSLCVVGAVTMLSACGGSDDPQPHVVQTLQADPQYSILVESAVAAEHVDTLSGTTPLTVFAPSNTAYASLLTELGVSKSHLLANTELLTAVPTYHVLPSSVPKASVPLGKVIAIAPGGIFQIDSVSAELVDTLSATGPLTVFAPTNAAFAALLEELGVTKEALLANKPLLTAVLSYHVLDGRVLKADVPVGAEIQTLVEGDGGTFTVDATLTITDQRGRTEGIAAPDVLTSNGVIHVIDKVIRPAE